MFEGIFKCLLGVCVCTHADVCVYHTFVWWLEVNGQCLYSGMVHLVFGSKVSQWIALAGEDEWPGIRLSLPSQCWGYKHVVLCWPISMGSEDETHVLTFAWPALQTLLTPQSLNTHFC